MLLKRGSPIQVQNSLDKNRNPTCRTGVSENTYSNQVSGSVFPRRGKMSKRDISE